MVNRIILSSALQYANESQQYKNQQDILTVWRNTKEFGQSPPLQFWLDWLQLFSNEIIT
jgi:hypothetical protein